MLEIQQLSGEKERERFMDLIEKDIKRVDRRESRRSAAETLTGKSQDYIYIYLIYAESLFGLHFV